MEAPHIQGNKYQIQYGPHLSFWILANILALFMVDRDGGLRIENEFSLGIRCTEKSRYTTDAVVTLVFRTRLVGQSRTR